MDLVCQDKASDHTFTSKTEFKCNDKRGLEDQNRFKKTFLSTIQKK